MDSSRANSYTDLLQDREIQDSIVAGLGFLETQSVCSPCSITYQHIILSFNQFNTWEWVVGSENLMNAKRMVLPIHIFSDA